MDRDGRRRGGFGLPRPDDARRGAGHPVVAGALVVALGLAALFNGLAARDPAVVVVAALVVALVLGIRRREAAPPVGASSQTVTPLAA